MVVTPESVRMGFIRIFASKTGSSSHLPASTIWRYAATNVCLARKPLPPGSGFARSAWRTSAPPRTASSTLRASSSSWGVYWRFFCQRSRSVDVVMDVNSTAWQSHKFFLDSKIDLVHTLQASERLYFAGYQLFLVSLLADKISTWNRKWSKSSFG